MCSTSIPAARPRDLDFNGTFNEHVHSTVDVLLYMYGVDARDPPTDDTFHHRRIERAQRRYLAAIKALAQVRKLGVPAVQVNIGEKQLNFVR